MSELSALDLFGSEPRHKPQADNASTIKPAMVQLIDGRSVPSTSPEWQAECEAMTVLSWDMEKRQNFFEMVERKRGADGLARLKRGMSQALPRYVLELPTKPARIAYLEAYERRISHEARKRLEQAVRDLHARRTAETCNTPAA